MKLYKKQNVEVTNKSYSSANVSTDNYFLPMSLRMPYFLLAF